MTDRPPEQPAGAALTWFSHNWQVEAISLVLLALMAVYFLSISWRKWPDPIVDSGPQLYAIWQVSEGAQPYHDFLWNYGPFSLCFNAALFKLFGPGLTVLATANLLFYALILVLAYLAFRTAWGRFGAFAATAVFISVFSFSHLIGIGNYNFVTPYAAEATHGMLLILVTLFIVVRWCRGISLRLAILLGLCGGVATVMKPEFMLACGVLGFAGLLLRWRENAAVTLKEYILIGAGLVLPTLAFTLWFARGESLKAAFVDASQAWWVVVVKQIQKGDVQQLTFSGLDHPAFNVWRELRFSFWALLVMGAIWAAGWIINRSWSWLVRGILVTALAVLSWRIFVWRISSEPGLTTIGWWQEMWSSIGWCLPGLLLGVVMLMFLRVGREWRLQTKAGESTVMALMLVLLGGAMLARMPLYARIYHLGFFQAALAAMVVSAMMVAELPRWTGSNRLGRGVATLGSFAVLALCCGSVVAASHKVRADQTEPVGWGRDQFYSTSRLIDGTGALVNWCAARMHSTPPGTEVLVLPEGVMINYLSRRKSPLGGQRGGEEQVVEKLRQKPPEYVVLISRDLKEFGIKHYGAPGNPGEFLIPWVAGNYQAEAQLGGDPLDPDGHVGAVIMRRKADANAGAVTNILNDLPTASKR